jgi:hypothetical protein
MIANGGVAHLHSKLQKQLRCKAVSLIIWNGIEKRVEKMDFSGTIEQS